MKALWRDPVWSKVIAGVILAALAAVGAYFLQWWPIIVRFFFVKIPLIYFIAMVVVAALPIYLLMDWMRYRPSGLRTHDGPHDFELQPISFMIDLAKDVPFVQVSYYAVNYRKHTIKLTEVKITQLRMSSGPTIEQISLIQEYPLAPKKSRMVFCRRSLLGSEVRIAAQENNQYPLNASFSLVAKARCGRHEYTYGPVSSKWIEGWVNKRIA